MKSMVYKTPPQTATNTSQLERFTLDFEYDKTLQQVKRELRVRSN